MTDFRDQAEKHWEYTGKLLELTGEEECLDLIHFLYVEAMVHGYKHAKEEK